ncbi:hypothetical protein ACFV19_11765 [Streptomyces griseoluteus]|uniref:hypothetical protein n=1 Tax=Streptomyces griseoluteus TaxID=29306 RepID=UPI00369B40CB
MAIMANWVGESVWRVTTTTARRDITPYREAIAHAWAHSLVDGQTPADPLQTLAAYLDPDWRWLITRCRVLGEEGVGRMMRPRSRPPHAQDA